MSQIQREEAEEEQEEEYGAEEEPCCSSSSAECSQSDKGSSQELPAISQLKFHPKMEDLEVDEQYPSDEEDDEEEESDEEAGPSSSSSGLQEMNSSTETEGVYGEEAAESEEGEIVGELAVVVGMHPRGLIVQSLPREESKPEFFLLDGPSRCLSSRRFNPAKFDDKLVHVFLKIVSTSKLHGQNVITNENHKKRKTDTKRKIEKRIDEYAINEDTWSDELGAFHHGYSDEANPRLEQKDKEIICLVVEPSQEKRQDIGRVVGPPSHQSFLVNFGKEIFSKHEFIKVDTSPSDSFFKLYLMFGTMCLVKDYKEEKRFHEMVKKSRESYTELKTCIYGEDKPDGESILLHHFPSVLDPPPGEEFPRNPRRLSADENKLMQNFCKHLRLREEKSKTAKKSKRQRQRKRHQNAPEKYDTEEQYDTFRLYIRDPALCICRFNSYQALKDSKRYTIRTTVRLVEQSEDCFLLINLTPKQTKQIHAKNTPWREGCELMIVNPCFKREKHGGFGLHTKSDAEVVIDKITLVSNNVQESGANMEEKEMRIKLRPTKNSKDLFDIIRQYKTNFAKNWSHIGPSPRDGASEILATGILKFKNFYENLRLFNWWRGYKYPDDVENLDYEMTRFVDIQNGIRLNESQSTALQHSFHREGITTTDAGPGSGKTLVSAALACRSCKVRRHERMAVTATTNLGVNNAVEKIVDLWSEFPISREMSRKGEIEVDKSLEKYCLPYQSLHSPQPHPKLLKVREEYKKVLDYYHQAETRQEKLNRFEMLHYAESKVKRYYLRTAIPFCGASTPALLVRHADHYNLVLDGAGRSIRRDIQHLVVDEASQLPYYTSLALCCSFPQLERLTMIGDRKQLGPHCVLYNEVGLLNDLCTLSELDRINGLKTVEEYSLRINYRGHPWMVSMFLQPHYGPTFLPHLTAQQRRLAFDKRLPMINTNSVETMKPVAFVNIKPGEDCHNESERAGVLKLIKDFMNKDVTAARVSILCFHRKQKEEMEKSLKEAGNLDERMKSFVGKLGVHTIDSFQGRENDIIIACTTKSVHHFDRDKAYYDRVFQFVADPRRGIVAISRAKEAMYIFGQWKYLRFTAFWKDYVCMMRREKLIFDEDWNELHF